MRKSANENRADQGARRPPGRRVEEPYDEKRFFESFYQSNVRGELQDWMTIGPVTDLEGRFHYNVTENSILRAIARRQPPPPGVMVEAWRQRVRAAGLRALDIGSGTGHWIDFFREVLLVQHSIGVEIAGNMYEHLCRKYAAFDQVQILNADVVDESFTADLIGGPVDYISAIGVMFHIVDDQRWRRAVDNLAAVLKPGGLLFVGGEFGPRDANVQFHGSDEFGSWREFRKADTTDERVRVNKRVRSLATWQTAAESVGLRIADLVRSDREAAITTPENDILVLIRPESPSA
jgi:SAM-dependent methyltransferase